MCLFFPHKGPYVQINMVISQFAPPTRHKIKRMKLISLAMATSWQKREREKKIHCVIHLIKQVGNWLIKISCVLCIYHGLVMPPSTRHEIKGMKLISLVMETSLQKREREKNTLRNSSY